MAASKCSLNCLLPLTERWMPSRRNREWSLMLSQLLRITLLSPGIVSQTLVALLLATLRTRSPTPGDASPYQNKRGRMEDQTTRQWGRRCRTNLRADSTALHNSYCDIWNTSFVPRWIIIVCGADLPAKSLFTLLWRPRMRAPLTPNHMVWPVPISWGLPSPAHRMILSPTTQHLSAV